MFTFNFKSGVDWTENCNLSFRELRKEVLSVEEWLKKPEKETKVKLGLCGKEERLCFEKERKDKNEIDIFSYQNIFVKQILKDLLERFSNTNKSKCCKNISIKTCLNFARFIATETMNTFWPLSLLKSLLVRSLSFRQSNFLTSV